MLFIVTDLNKIYIVIRAANYALVELRWLKDSFILSEVEENPVLTAPF
jgi:hypothetical protein